MVNTQTLPGSTAGLELWRHANAAVVPASAGERDITHARHGGAPTSCAAQLDRQQHAAQQRARVYLAILDAGPCGLTVDELAEAWGLAPNRLSGRFTELKAAGLLKIAGERRTRTGSRATAYAASGAPTTQVAA